MVLLKASIAMVRKYYVFQKKIAAYNVNINKNFVIISFLVLWATIRARLQNFYKETILKVPSIYLVTLVSVKCKYVLTIQEKLDFGVAIITTI